MNELKKEWLKPVINSPDWPILHVDEECIKYYKKGIMSNNNFRWYIIRRFDYEPTWKQAGIIIEIWITLDEFMPEVCNELFD